MVSNDGPQLRVRLLDADSICSSTLQQTDSHPTAAATATASHPHVSIATPTPRPLSSSPLSPHRGSPAPPCSSSTTAPPAEIEATLTRLSTHQGVLGCLVLSRHDGLVIRSGGQMFEPSGPGAKGRAEMLKSVTRLVKSSVESLAGDIRGIDETVSCRSKRGQHKWTCTDSGLVCDTGRARIPAHQDQKVRDHDHAQRQVSVGRAAGRFAPELLGLSHLECWLFSHLSFSLLHPGVRQDPNAAVQ